MLLNKITSALKSDLGNLLEPLKKIAQDLGQISAYVKDSRRTSLALLEKRIDPPQDGLPCDDNLKGEIVGDIVFAEKEQRALGRLIDSDQASVKKLEAKIKPKQDKIDSLDQESKKLRKKMTSPWDSLWERGKTAIGAAKQTPKDVVDLILSDGTARETELFVKMNRNQDKGEKLVNAMRDPKKDMRFHQANINFFKEEKNKFADKETEFKAVGEECAARDVQ